MRKPMFTTRIDALKEPLQNVALMMCLACSSAFAAEQELWQPPAPLSPQASRDAIVVPEGFTVELVAAEPLVMDPVSFAWGLDGRLWVVEMPDYNWLPINDKSPDKPRGRVIFLTDTDGDGKYDKRTVFLDDLHYPTSVLPWRSGILVTAAPDILYAEDTTPDDDNPKADKREILYTGFGEGNPQLRVNGLQWGLDNWIYCANGWSHGVIKSTKTGKTLDIRGRDLRIRPDTGEIEPASGVSQYGRVRDDYGNWFGVDNSRLIIHYVFEDHHLRRNPHVAAPQPFIDLVTPKNPPCFPLGRKVDRLHAPYMANRFTSACGIAVYRDSLIKEFKDNVFICEPVHNLVTRRVLTPDGVTFKAERVKGEEQSEFLASTDEWFRPVHARTGPDGALWIADMYRAVIEHPQWLPKDFNKKVNWMQGSEKGRVYRVVRKNVKPHPMVELDKLNVDELVAALESPNGTRRDTAHMMLVWRGRGEASDAVIKVVEVERLGIPVRQMDWLTYLCVLDGMGALDIDYLHWMPFGDQGAHCNPHRIRLAEQFADPMESDRNRASALELVTQFQTVGNPDALMQSAFSLGAFANAESADTLAQLMLYTVRIPQLTDAILSSSVNHAPYLLQQAAHEKPDAIASDLIPGLLRTIVGVEDDTVLVRAAHDVADPQNALDVAGRLDAMAALYEAVASKARKPLNHELAANPGHSQSRHEAFLKYARQLLQHEPRELRVRVAAAKLLGHLPSQDNERALLNCLKPATPAQVRQAALHSLFRHGRIETITSLFSPSQWHALTPRDRDAILNHAVQREGLAVRVLEHIQKGELSVTNLSLQQRQTLLSAKSPAIRELAAKIIQPITSNRAALLESHRDVLTTPGDIARGQTHFEKTCAACHKISGSGRGFGPDLGALSDRSPQALLTAILDPNQAVDPRYVNYIIETKEGETHTGILLSETGNAIILGGADGNRQSILRADIDAMRSGGLSLMPEGLEQALGKQGLADVIAYVISASQPRRVIAAMKPAIVKADGNGAIHLPVTQAQAFGTTIDYETEDNNIGSWTRREDHLAWSIDVETGGNHEIWFDYAADAKWLGNQVVVIVENDAGEQITRKLAIPVTATKDDYHQKSLGEIKLPRGTIRLLLKPEGPITGELMHLRALRLAPKK